MSTKRRVIIETNNGGQCPDQDVITYTLQEGLHRAVASWIWESPGRLQFQPVGDEDPYTCPASKLQWDRLTINVSPPICQAEGGDCWNILEHEDEKATQVCWQCHMAAGGEE